MAATLTRAQLNELTIPQLKNILKNINLPVGGSKSDLITRVIESNTEFPYFDLPPPEIETLVRIDPYGMDVLEGLADNPEQIPDWIDIDVDLTLPMRHPLIRWKSMNKCTISTMKRLSTFLRVLKFIDSHHSVKSISNFQWQPQVIVPERVITPRKNATFAYDIGEVYSANSQYNFGGYTRFLRVVSKTASGNIRFFPLPTIDSDYIDSEKKDWNVTPELECETDMSKVVVGYYHKIEGWGVTIKDADESGNVYDHQRWHIVELYDPTHIYKVHSHGD